MVFVACDVIPQGKRPKQTNKHTEKGKTYSRTVQNSDMTRTESAFFVFLQSSVSL